MLLTSLICERSFLSYSWLQATLKFFLALDDEDETEMQIALIYLRREHHVLIVHIGCETCVVFL